MPRFSAHVHIVLFLLLACTLTPTTALGDGNDSGHYDPDSVASASVIFRAFAGQLQQVYGPIDDTVRKVDGLLADLDLSLALTTGHVDQAHYDLWAARLDERSTRFGPEFQAVQERSYSLQDQSTKAFEQALGRALQSLSSAGHTAPVSCTEGSGGIGPMGGLGGASAAQCPGKNLSARIAGLWDKDPLLKQDLDNMTTGQWPEVTNYEDAARPLALDGRGDAGQWLSPAQLARGIPEAARLLNESDARAQAGRDALWAALRNSTAGSEDEQKELKQAIRSRAKRIREYSARSRAALGATLWGAVDRARKKGKKEGWSEVALCLNPTGWGGCDGMDHTDDVLNALYGDKKLTRQIETLLEDLGQPDVSMP